MRHESIFSPFWNKKQRTGNVLIRHIAGSGYKIKSFFLEAISKTEIYSVELALATVENVGKSELIANLQREVLVGSLCASP